MMNWKDTKGIGRVRDHGVYLSDSMFVDDKIGKDVEVKSRALF
jgi:hypothetical protein